MTSAEGGLANLGYTYDDLGNRTGETKNGTPRVYTYENGLLTGAGTTTYTYTPEGSLATKTDGADNWVYNWDNLGWLASVQKNAATIGTYGYDAGGLRVWKEENGQTTLYIRASGEVLYQETFTGPVEAASTPLTTKAFVFLAGQLLGTVINKAEAHYYLNDHLGTTEIVTDGEGRVTENIQHTPFSDLTHVTATAYQRMAASNPDWIDTAATTAQVVEGRIVPAKAPQETSVLLHQDNQTIGTEDPHYVTAKEFTFEHGDPDVVELKVLSSFKYAGSGGQYVEYEDRIDLTGKPLGTYKVRLETRKDVGGGEPTENLKFEVYVSKVLAPVESIVQTTPIAVAPGAKAFCLSANGTRFEDVAWAYSIDGGQGWVNTELGARVALAPEIGSVLIRATLSPDEGQPVPEIESFDVGVESERAESGRYFFTGKERDVSGLYYFGARYYDPEIGRFTTVDPACQELNWYEYCKSNPLMYVDPDGKVAIPFRIITSISIPGEFIHGLIIGTCTGLGAALGYVVGGTGGGVIGTVAGPGGTVAGAVGGAELLGAAGAAVGASIGEGIWQATGKNTQTRSSSGGFAKPTSKTFGKPIETTINGKKVQLRVDAEPDAMKIQIQAGRGKNSIIDIRIDPTQPIAPQIPKNLNLTKGQLLELIKNINKAIEWLNS